MITVEDISKFALFKDCLLGNCNQGCTFRLNLYQHTSFNTLCFFSDDTGSLVKKGQKERHASVA